MPRSRFGNDPLPRPPFFNRVQQQQLVIDQVRAVHSDPQHFRVLAFMGLGGIGKTRLLDELWHQKLAPDGPIRRFWVSLGAEEQATEVGPLLSFREQTDIDCLLFDAALLTYWHAMGQPFHREQGIRLRNSLAVQAVQTAGGAMGVPLPLSFALGLFESARHRLVRARHYSKSEFEEIDRLRHSPQDLLSRLRHFLGLDLRRRLDAHEKPVVAFLDG
jgi:hypothetical protein